MGTKLHHTIRVIAYTLWFTALVAIGSVLSDFDHVLPPFRRSWGHNYLFVMAVFVLGIGATYLYRWIRARILRR